MRFGSIWKKKRNTDYDFLPPLYVGGKLKNDANWHLLRDIYTEKYPTAIHHVKQSVNCKFLNVCDFRRTHILSAKQWKHRE